MKKKEERGSGMLTTSERRENEINETERRKDIKR